MYKPHDSAVTILTMLDRDSSAAHRTQEEAPAPSGSPASPGHPRDPYEAPAMTRRHAPAGAAKVRPVPEGADGPAHPSEVPI